MKLLVFAGGAGKRFWPIGRKNKPKQFLQIFDKKSTFELTLNRLIPVYGIYNIFVSTTENYVSQVKRLAPQLPSANIFTEPARRDVGPAVGLALMRLKKLGVKEPVAIIWADHFIKNTQKFQNILKQAELLILKNKAEVVLVGEEPQFPATNLGWIKIKPNKKHKFAQFNGFVYRPELKVAQHLYETKTGLWNTAYMISTIDTLLKFYSRHAPDIYNMLQKIYQSLETPEEGKVLEEVYPKIPKVHFDHIVSYNLNSNKTIVLSSKMDWADPGTLFSFKKTLEPGLKNYEKGNIKTFEVQDSLIINEDKDKILVAGYLKNIIIVNTKDALLIIPASKVKNISDIYKYLEQHPKLSRFIE